jgi:hypothetical protein
MDKLPVKGAISLIEIHVLLLVDKMKPFSDWIQQLTIRLPTFLSMNLGTVILLDQMLYLTFSRRETGEKTLLPAYCCHRKIFDVASVTSITNTENATNQQIKYWTWNKPID